MLHLCPQSRIPSTGIPSILPKNKDHYSFIARMFGSNRVNSLQSKVALASGSMSSAWYKGVLSSMAQSRWTRW